MMIVEIAAGVAGVAATIGIYLWSKRDAKKSLGYEYTAARLVRREHPFEESIRIMFGDLEISDATLITVIIKNTGKAPIDRADFDGSLEIRIHGVDNVVAHQVAVKIPDDLRVALDLAEGAGNEPPMLTIKPLLLNQGDRFALWALVSGYGDGVTVSGRIKGVKQIDAKIETNLRLLPSGMRLAVGIGGLLSAAMGVVIASGSMSKHSTLVLAQTLVAVGIAGASLMLMNRMR